MCGPGSSIFPIGFECSTEYLPRLSCSFHKREILLLNTSMSATSIVLATFRSCFSFLSRETVLSAADIPSLIFRIEFEREIEYLPSVSCSFHGRSMPTSSFGGKGRRKKRNEPKCSRLRVSIWLGWFESPDSRRRKCAAGNSIRLAWRRPILGFGRCAGG